MSAGRALALCLIAAACGDSSSAVRDDAGAADADTPISADAADASDAAVDAGHGADAGLWPDEPVSGQFASAWVYPGNVFGVRMDRAADGGFAVAGTVLSGTIDFGGTPFPDGHTWDLFAAAIDPDGDARWVRRFGGADSEMLRAVATTATGDVALTGHFASAELDFGDGPNAAAGGDDAFVAVLHGIDGSTVWARTFGSAFEDVGYGIAAAPDGDIVWAGGTRDIIDVGGGPLGSDVALAPASLVIARYSSDGEHRWSRAVVGAHSPQTQVAVSASGTTVVAGRFAGSVDFGGEVLVASTTGVTGTDGFVASYDTEGQLIFAVAIRDAGASWIAALAVDPDSGAVWVAGANDGGDLGFDTGGVIVASGFDDDAFVAKLDPSGRYVSGWAMGSVDDDYILAIAAATDGGVYASVLCRGPFEVDGAAVACADEGQSTAVIRFDADGGVEWVSTMTSSNYVWAEAVVGVPESAVYVAGDTSGMTSFGGPVVPQSGLFVGIIAERRR